MLSVIFLAGNHIKDTGAKKIAKGLQRNSSLHSLLLNGKHPHSFFLDSFLHLDSLLIENYICNSGAKALADALRVNRTLTYLELGSIAYSLFECHVRDALRLPE